MKIKFVPILQMIVFLTTGLAADLYAYKTDTHQDMTKKIADLSGRYKKFTNEFKLDSNVSQGLMVFGSFAEDEYPRFFNHFYDPIDESGLVIPAVLWGYESPFPFLNSYSWTKARGYLYQLLTSGDQEIRDTNFRKMSRSLGQIVHLVEDMAQPSHVRNDPHSSHYESEAGAFLLNPSHLEDWAQFHQDQVSDFINIATGPRPVDSFEDAFETLALFTNQNFFSDDTIFKNYVFPSKEETNYTDSFIRLGILGEPVQVLAEDGHIYTVPYIIKTQGTYYGYKLAQVGYFGEQLIQLDEFRDLAFLIDDEVAKENAQILIPQAVGYSAGLLDYFFRGQIDMVKDPNTAGQYIIQNKSGEPMTGTFSLYYDDTNNNRYLVASWNNLSINPNGQSSSLTFKLPTSPQPKEKGNYILAFQGSLGNETEAVVGNVVKLETASHVFIIQEICKITGGPSPFSSFSIPSSAFRSQTWYNSPQVAEGRFIIYGNVKEIALRTFTVLGNPPAQNPSLFINGQSVPGGIWHEGDTSGLPSTWRIENLSSRIPYFAADGLVALEVTMEDSSVFTQHIAQYVSYSHYPDSSPYQSASKSLRFNRIEIVQGSLYSIYIPPSFDIVQIQGYSEGAQLNHQTAVNIEFYYDDYLKDYPNFITLSSYPVQSPFHHYIAEFWEQKVAYLPIPSNFNFAEFPFNYLPLTFSAEIQKTYSQEELEEFREAGIIPPHYSVVFK